MPKELKKCKTQSYSNSIPTRLWTADELSVDLGKKGIKITVERILELANSLFMPHYRIDNGEPQFVIQEAVRWISGNLLQRIDGYELPMELRVTTESVPNVGSRDTPMELHKIADKLITQPIMHNVCGVYFLCRLNKILYIGQSHNCASRIANHGITGKKFDCAYILPCPVTELDSLEGSFIRAIKPPLNISSGCATTHHKFSDLFDAESHKHA